MFKQLSVERISLSLITHKHAKALFAILNEPEVAQFNDYDFPLSRDDVKQMIQYDLACYYEQSGIRFVIINNQTHEIMGSVGLYDIKNGKAWVGFELATKFWHQGYMFEVLNYLVVNKAHKHILKPIITSFYANVDEANYSSQKLLSKIGFTRVSNEVWEYE